MTPPQTAVKSALQRYPSVLFLQHGSIFESFGGVEYYLDDLVQATVQLSGNENVRTIVPLADRPRVTRSYRTDWVYRRRNALLRKLENRIPVSAFRRACKLIEESRPDLLVASHVHFAPLVYALHRRYRLPYASVVYGIECWGDLLPHEEFALRNSDFIWSISDWTKNVLVKRGYPASKMSILHPRLPAGMETARQNPVRKNGTVTFLTVSRLDALERYKGHDHVLEALRRLSHSHPTLDYRYIIQGDGSDRERLENVVRTLGLTAKVAFRASVKNRTDLQSVYSEADVFLMPSRFGKWDGRWRGEGFGIVHVEAAAFGVPSIAYACGGVMDILEHDKDGWLVNPDDIEGLAQAIARFCDDPALRERLGKAAYQTARSKFSEQATRAEVAAALKQVTG